MTVAMTARWNYGKIYILVNSVDDNTYIGSTCDTLLGRMRGHRGHVNCSNRLLYKHIRSIGVENLHMLLIEQYPCHSQTELEVRETQWVTELKPTLNTRNPTSTPINYYNMSNIEHEHVEKIRNMVSNFQQSVRDSDNQKVKPQQVGNVWILGTVRVREIQKTTPKQVNNIRREHTLEAKYLALQMEHHDMLQKHALAKEILLRAEEEIARVWRVLHNFCQ